MYNKKLSAVLIAGALLASGPALAAPTDAAVVSNTCAGCHGTDGASVGPAPIIGGLSEAYQAATMAAYKDGTRWGTIMNRIAKGYTPGEILDMAKHFAGKPWVSGKQPVDAKLAEKGKTIHSASGCAGCHGANGISPMPSTPRLTGQYMEYLVYQMNDYKDPNKAIPPAAMAMRGMLGNVSEEDIKALAHFYAGAR
jgi:sulfide dehydrogenase cytochrome subunit